MSNTLSLTELHELMETNYAYLMILAHLGDEFQLISEDSKKTEQIELSNPWPMGLYCVVWQAYKNDNILFQSYGSNVMLKVCNAKFRHSKNQVIF